MGVEAVRSGPTSLREVGAVAVVVCLALGTAGHADEAEAEGERDGDAVVGSDVGPVDGGAVVAAGTLEGLHIHGRGGGEKR